MHSPLARARLDSITPPSKRKLKPRWRRSPANKIASIREERTEQSLPKMAAKVTPPFELLPEPTDPLEKLRVEVVLLKAEVELLKLWARRDGKNL